CARSPATGTFRRGPEPDRVPVTAASSDGPTESRGDAWKAIPKWAGCNHLTSPSSVPRHGRSHSAPVCTIASVQTSRAWSLRRAWRSSRARCLVWSSMASLCSRASSASMAWPSCRLASDSSPLCRCLDALRSCSHPGAERLDHRCDRVAVRGHCDAHCERPGAPGLGDGCRDRADSERLLFVADRHALDPDALELLSQGPLAHERVRTFPLECERCKGGALCGLGEAREHGLANGGAVCGHARADAELQVRLELARTVGVEALEVDRMGPVECAHADRVTGLSP